MERLRPGVCAAVASCRSLFGPLSRRGIFEVSQTARSGASASGEQMNGGSQAVDGLLESAGAGQSREILVKELLQPQQLLFAFLHLGQRLKLPAQAGRHL